MRCSADLRSIAEFVDVATVVTDRLRKHVSEMPKATEDHEIQSIHGEIQGLFEDFVGLRTRIAQTNAKVTAYSERSSL